MINIGKSIAKARKREGMSRAKLAELANTSYATLYQIENGSLEPSIDLTADIVRALQAERMDKHGI